MPPPVIQWERVGAPNNAGSTVAQLPPMNLAFSLIVPTPAEKAPYGGSKVAEKPPTDQDNYSVVSNDDFLDGGDEQPFTPDVFDEPAVTEPAVTSPAETALAVTAPTKEHAVTAPAETAPTEEHIYDVGVAVQMTHLQQMPNVTLATVEVFLEKDRQLEET